MGTSRAAAAAGTLVVTVLLAAAANAAGHVTTPTGAVDHQNPAQFIDLAGDGAGAADVTSTTASSLRDGTLQLHVRVANRTFLAANDLIGVWIDTDGNPTTGAAGFEYLIVLSGQTRASSLFRWDGAQLVLAPSPSLRVGFVNGHVITISRDDIGSPRAINFFVLTAVIGGQQTQADVAPNQGAWSFTLTRAHAELLTATFAPRVPRAGRRFEPQLVTLRLATGERVRPDAYRCTATLGGMRISRAGACTFSLPRKARGKLLVVTVTATLGDETLSVRYRYRVGAR